MPAGSEPDDLVAQVLEAQLREIARLIGDAPDGMSMHEIRMAAMGKAVAKVRELDAARDMVLMPREPSVYMAGRGAEALDIRPSEARQVYDAMLVAREREREAPR